MKAIGSDQVVLTVNGEKITAKQFDKVLNAQKKIFRVQNFEELKTEELVWIKTRGLNEIIRNTLIAQEIAKENISIDRIDSKLLDPYIKNPYSHFINAPKVKK